MTKYKENFFNIEARQIMSRSPKTVSPDARITEAEEMMRTHKIHSIVVTDESRRAGRRRGVLQRVGARLTPAGAAERGGAFREGGKSCGPSSHEDLDLWILALPALCSQDEGRWQIRRHAVSRMTLDRAVPLCRSRSELS